MLIKKHCKSLTTYTDELPSYVLGSSPMFHGYVDKIPSNKTFKNGDIFVLTKDITSPINAKNGEGVIYINDKWHVVNSLNQIYVK